ncbi:MAG: HEPN domain-containing protein [Candidatus Andersenbacteria bacterium]
MRKGNSQSEYRNIAKARLKSVEILLIAGDWHLACYVMGQALECALKASICKTLRIPRYPEGHKDQKLVNFFMTHTFDRLLILSGLNDIFNAGGDPSVYDNWSSFTIRYPGEWTAMRYNDPQSNEFNDEVLAKKLFKYLYEDEDSIIKTISKCRRW